VLTAAAQPGPLRKIKGRMKQMLRVKNIKIKNKGHNFQVKPTINILYNL
jgi:hypothetical protein